VTDINPTPRDADADLAICNAAPEGPYTLRTSLLFCSVIDPDGNIIAHESDDSTLDRGAAELFAISREALPYWIGEAGSLEALAEGQNREIETLRAEVADLRSREVIEHDSTYFAPLAITNGTWEWYNSGESSYAYVGGDSLPLELYAALPDADFDKPMAYPTREAALQALRDAIEKVKKREDQS